MPYPFPGMNPWLENPLVWRDVHHNLISILREDLAPKLRPRYFIAVEFTTYVAQLPDVVTSVRYPEVMVLERGGPAVATAAIQAADPYVTVELPLDDIEIAHLEVRLVPDGDVVTVIELLSPTNKRAGDERDAYIRKRRELLGTDVSFVEIDLLRDWQPMPYTDTRAGDYRLFIRRRNTPVEAHLYPFGVRQPIPKFPLPLLPGDTESIVDLGALLQTAYDRAGYDLILDYSKPPVPPLSEADAAWAAELLAASAK